MKRRPCHEATPVDASYCVHGGNQPHGRGLFINRQHHDCLWFGLHGVWLLPSMVLAALLLPPTLLASTRLPAASLSAAKTGAPDCTAAGVSPDKPAGSLAKPAPGHTASAAGKSTCYAACDPASDAACKQACCRATTRHVTSHATWQKVLVSM